MSNTKTFDERLVVAYPNEETLRDLIAAPSIIGLGFVSREQALAAVEGDFPKTAVLRDANKKATAGGNKKKFQFHSVMNGFPDGLSFSQGCGIARSFLQVAATSAILFLYSRNIVSATVRAMLAGSI